MVAIACRATRTRSLSVRWVTVVNDTARSVERSGAAQRPAAVRGATGGVAARAKSVVGGEPLCHLLPLGVSSKGRTGGGALCGWRSHIWLQDAGGAALARWA